MIVGGYRGLSHQNLLLLANAVQVEQASLSAQSLAHCFIYALYIGGLRPLA